MERAKDPTWKAKNIALNKKEFKLNVEESNEER